MLQVDPIEVTFVHNESNGLACLLSPGGRREGESPRRGRRVRQTQPGVQRVPGGGADLQRGEPRPSRPLPPTGPSPHRALVHVILTSSVCPRRWRRVPVEAAPPTSVQSERRRWSTSRTCTRTCCPRSQRGRYVCVRVLACACACSWSMK